MGVNSLEIYEVSLLLRCLLGSDPLETRLHFLCFEKKISRRKSLRDGNPLETRLHFLCFAKKIKVRLGLALAANSPQDCWNLFSSRRHRKIKKQITKW